MKLLLLIGGFLGFAIGLAFSWVQESSWPSSLWHACVAAYLAGMLMRWWGKAWQKNLEEAMLDAQNQGASQRFTALSKSSKT